MVWSNLEHSGMLFALKGNIEQHTKTNNKFSSPHSRLRGEALRKVDSLNVNQSVITNTKANQPTLSHIASPTDKPSISGFSSSTTPTPQSIDLNTNEVHAFEIKIEDDWN